MDLEAAAEVISDFEKLEPPMLNTPCKECPWRTDSTPGHLGGHSALLWIQIVTGDGPVACHLTCVPEGKWVEGVKQCRGAANFRRNLGKLPRIAPDLQRGTQDRKGIFTTPGAFISHHEGDDE